MSKQLYPHFNQNFDCDNCLAGFWNKTAYSPTKASRFLDETYCVECVKVEVGFCSFHNKGKQKKCSHPLFNKKRQLCRSHYFKVWKRLNKKKILHQANQFDKRITGRTKQLNLRVSEETYWRMKDLASKNKCLMTEVLEKVLGVYEEK